MLKDELKKQSLLAMKAGDDVAKGILRLALGEVQTAEARQSKELTDEEVTGVVRKLLKSNEETLALTAEGPDKAQLTREIAVLKALLPSSLGVSDIVKALAGEVEAIKAAKSEGQATGVAMKVLKAASATVNGTDVALAVKQIRG